MNWRTTNLAKFIVASPKAILPLFSQMKQVELSQTMPTKFHRDESQDKVQTKKLFSKCTLFMCALSPLITIYLWLTHRIKHTCMCVHLHAHLHNCSPLFYLGVFIRCWIIWNYSISMCLCDIVSKVVFEQQLYNFHWNILYQCYFYNFCFLAQFLNKIFI